MNSVTVTARVSEEPGPVFYSEDEPPIYITDLSDDDGHKKGEPTLYYVTSREAPEVEYGDTVTVEGRLAWPGYKGGITITADTIKKV